MASPTPSTRACGLFRTRTAFAVPSRCSSFSPCSPERLAPLLGSEARLPLDALRVSVKARDREGRLAIGRPRIVSILPRASSSTPCRALSYAALRTFSRTTLGWRAAMRSSASAGPSGVLRSCSQFRRVCTLIPNASAKFACVRPMKRRKAGCDVAGLQLATHDALPLAPTEGLRPRRPLAFPFRPTVLVEITSDSSEEYDTGFKVDAYRTVPSLRERRRRRADRGGERERGPRGGRNLRRDRDRPVGSLTACAWRGH